MAKSRKEQLEELLSEMPDDPFLRYGLAMEYVSAGQDEEAVLKFRDLMQRAPEYVPGYLLAGQALARLGRTTDAKSVWGQGVTLARQQGDRHITECLPRARPGRHGFPHPTDSFHYSGRIFFRGLVEMMRDSTFRAPMWKCSPAAPRFRGMRRSGRKRSDR